MGVSKTGLIRPETPAIPEIAATPAFSRALCNNINVSRQPSYPELNLPSPLNYYCIPTYDKMRSLLMLFFVMVSVYSLPSKSKTERELDTLGGTYIHPERNLDALDETSRLRAVLGELRNARQHSFGQDSGLSEYNKRAFDRIGGNSEFREFNKRAFDRIGGNSEFREFNKRAFDRIGSNSEFRDLNKRAFDKIDSNSQFSDFNKRAFDKIGDNSAFSTLAKKSFDKIGHHSEFASLEKKRS